jgi:hypothetical protein
MQCITTHNNQTIVNFEATYFELIKLFVFSVNQNG